MFIASFDRTWDLEDLFRRFDAEFVDLELISSMDILLSEKEIETWYIDNILTTLINKIRNDADKRTSIAKYIARYADTFEHWDKESQKLEDGKVNSQNQQLIEAYRNILDPNVSKYYKYEAAYELSKILNLFKNKIVIL